VLPPVGPGPPASGAAPPPFELEPPLPPLEEELWLHGGSYLYAPEGDRLGWPADDCDAHYELLRLPECWEKPHPLTFGPEFLGADPVLGHGKWCGPCGYHWEPRLVVYGSYQVFAAAFELAQQRQDAVGHQLLVDIDLRLTGTERFHVQYRPLGRRNTGGSFYRFQNPAGYVDNSTGEPDRYWFEGELASIFGSHVSPFAPLDYHVTVGRFPVALHNSLLMNDDVLGVIVNKNTIYLGALSNLNVQAIYAFNDVDAFDDNAGRMAGLNASADYRRMFFEATYAFVEHEFDGDRNRHYAALSGTKLLGRWTLAARSLFTWGDRRGHGDGQIYVLESNRGRVFDAQPCGVESAVLYLNAFKATAGWRPISGGNFDRLRTAFEVNPLITISARGAAEETWGAALGVQLFRHHRDESFTPEIAFEAPGGVSVWGVGLRWQRKTGRRSFFELLGLVNWSDEIAFRREGVFLSQTIVF